MGVGPGPCSSLAAPISPVFAPGAPAMEQEGSPRLQRCVPTPLTFHSWRCGGYLVLTSQDWLRSMQLCSPPHCRCGHFWWKHSIWRGFELAPVVGQKNGLTTELVTEGKKKERRRQSHLLVCFFWVPLKKKTKEFSVIPGLVLGFVFGVGFFFSP